MPVRALRFLHAANLRLDAAPIPPLAVPDDLQPILDEASATAFAQIVSLAVEKDVDALILTGNTFDAAAGSLSAEVTLHREFRRLAEHDIPVCVTPGICDPPSAWRDLPELPDNVTVFFAGNEPGIELTADGESLATILPISSKAGHDAPELNRLRHGTVDETGFVIGMWIPDHNQATTLTPAFSAVDYLAVGQHRHHAAGPLTDGHVQIQAGPQGLSEAETGWQGCRLVDVSALGQIHTQLIPVAPVRWETCQVDIRGMLDREELCERMLAHLELLPGYQGEKVRIIHWPLEQAVLESVGVKTEGDLDELRATLHELTDEPKKGLRYLHRIEPLWDDARFPAAVDRELWQDFLAELDRSASMEFDRLQKLWEQHSGTATTPAGWPADVSWPPVSPERVRRRALASGRQWFSQTAGGASR
jgi:hypothetical protein